MTPVVGLGLDPGRTRLIYEWDAQRYLQSLPLEHFMESTAQSTQRKITVASFDVIGKTRPDIQCFSELLIQYPRPGEDPDQPGRVVPDNMIVVSSVPVEAEGSFMTPLQPFGPTLILEYVSKTNERKDYQDNYKKYEEDLKVPYYLVFHPEREDLRLFRIVREKYLELLPNSFGRFAVPDLELETGLLDGWVRFWFRGTLVPLTVDLVDEVEDQKRLRAEAEKQREQAEKQREQAEKRANQAELARIAAEQTRANTEQRLTASEEARKAAEERAAAAEAELERLHAQTTRPFQN